jgi:hypothetical protein
MVFRVVRQCNLNVQIINRSSTKAKRYVVAKFALLFLCMFCLVTHIQRKTTMYRIELHVVEPANVQPISTSDRPALKSRRIDQAPHKPMSNQTESKIS